MPGRTCELSPQASRSVIDWKVFLINSGGAANNRVRRLVAVCCHRSCVHIDTHTHSRESFVRNAKLHDSKLLCRIWLWIHPSLHNCRAGSDRKCCGPCDLLCSEKGPRNCFWFHFSSLYCLGVLPIDFLHFSIKA